MLRKAYKLVPNPPANLILTPKMVCGKEVQLVTPNVGASRRQTRMPHLNSLIRPMGPNNLTRMPENRVLPGTHANTFRAPVGVPVRPPPHQQSHKPVVNLRKAVGGAEKAPPPVQNNQQKSNLIKLTSNKSRDEPKSTIPNSATSSGDSGEDLPVINDEEVSTRQLAENWLHSGASRKIAKQPKDKKQLTNQQISKATEKILEMNNKIPIKHNNHKIEKKSKGTAIHFFCKCSIYNMATLLYTLRVYS